MPSADLLSWADTQPRTGAFGINPAVTTEGVPAVGWYHGFLEVKQSGRRLTLTESSGGNRTWINATSSNQWIGWKLQALATPPQEFNLPLADGFTNGGNASTYWKDQFGVVHVEFCVQKSGSTYETADVFATLPAGFRPKRRVHVGGIGDGITAGTGIIAMEVYIEPNGSMYLYHANSNIQWVVGEMSFLAAD